MNRKIWLLSIVIVFSQGLLAGSADIKQAFVAGIKASMDVIAYEQKQLAVPIKEGYCLSVSLRERPLYTWEIVKLESLGLLLKCQPAFFVQKSADISSESLLCLSVRHSKKSIEEDAQKIRRRYPRLSRYVTGIVFLSTNRRIHRAVPGIKMAEELNRRQVRYGRDNPGKQKTAHKGVLNTNQRAKQSAKNNPYVQDTKIVHRRNGAIVSRTELKDIYIVTHPSGEGEI